MISFIRRIPDLLLRTESSNTGVTTTTAEFNGWATIDARRTNDSMFTASENLIAKLFRPQIAIILATVFALVTLSGNTASAEVRAADIEAVFGTAVEVRPPSAIVIASNSGLLTLNFDDDSELRIGSNKAEVEQVAEGDRVIATATRNAEDELVALKTLVRVANTQPITRHVVGVVSNLSADQLAIQTRNGGVVDVLIPAGIDPPSIGDGITMVARLDRSSGILTAVGFELTSNTVERIQDAQDKAADQAESARLAQIAIDARSQHLTALDDAARAIRRVIDSARADQEVLDRATQQLAEIQRRFEELKGIYESTARSRGEAQPLLKISGALVDEVGITTFTIVPNGEQDEDPFSVDFTYVRDETVVDLPDELLKKISEDAENPQLLGDVRTLIDPGSELDVKYSIDGDVRTAVSIKVRLPRLLGALEAVLEHESRRAFNGVITLVEIDRSLEGAVGVVIAANDRQDVKVAAKVTDQTEITIDGRSSVISALRPGQAVDIQFETPERGSVSDITAAEVPLRAIAIRARSQAPSSEDRISGIVESIEPTVPAITIRPTDGSLIRLIVDEDAVISRNGEPASLDNVRVGDLVVDATRIDSDSELLTSLVVVARTNVKFSGTVTGIGQEPKRLQVTGDNGRLLNILVTDETWVIVDERRVRFSSLATGMNIVNGVYSVTGRGGAFYNVATIVSIESPKVVRATGVIDQINVIEGKLTVLSGKSDQTELLELRLPETPLGENLQKDGVPIRSLLEVERGDRVDIVFYVVETGVIEKLSVVSDNFIQSRGTLLGVSDNLRFVQIELVNGDDFDLWIGPNATMHLNGRRIQTLRPVTDFLESAKEQDAEISALVPEVLFIQDSIGSDQGVVISISFQIKTSAELRADSAAQETPDIEITISGVIEAISGNQWVIDGKVFTVNRTTRISGGEPEVGEVAVAALISRRGGSFIAKTITVSRR